MHFTDTSLFDVHDIQVVNISVPDKSMNVLGQVRLLLVARLFPFLVLAVCSPSRVTPLTQLDGRIILAPVIAE